MLKRDRIFYSACVLSAIGIVLAVMGYHAALLLFVAAYLLRPSLHEFGLAHRYADERQAIIYSRSGNLAFIVVMFAAAALALWRLSRGEQPDELYELIFLGLAVRAVAGLAMVGEYRNAGAVIIGAVGVFLTLFVVAESGLSVASVFGLVVGGLIVGFALLARRYPVAIAVTIAFVVVAAIAFFDLYRFHAKSTAVWLLFVAPMVTAAACLLLGRGDSDKEVSPRLRAIVFGGLGGAAALVFALLLIISGRTTPATMQTNVVAGAPTDEVQGIACTGAVTYYADTRLASCTLAREDTLSGQPLPAGTVVHLTPEGYMDWCFLQQNTLIQGHLCRGEGHGFQTCFHPNGRLKTAWLAQNERINGVPCAAFRFLSVLFGGGDKTEFDDTGRLRFCTLSEDFTLEGKHFKKGSVVQFDATGKLVDTK